MEVAVEHDSWRRCAEIDDLSRVRVILKDEFTFRDTDYIWDCAIPLCLKELDCYAHCKSWTWETLYRLKKELQQGRDGKVIETINMYIHVHAYIYKPISIEWDSECRPIAQKSILFNFFHQCQKKELKLKLKTKEIEI